MTTGYRPEIIQSAFINFLGSRLQPFWSLTTAKLRLVARHNLSDELVALEFETNQAFRRQAFELFDDWHGGQHISLSIPIEGVYHQRHYSLVGFYNQPHALQQAIFANSDSSRSKGNNHSTLDKNNTITIAIKPQGLVSNYLTQQAALGTIFDSGIPVGDFTLEHNHSSVDFSSNSPLLFIAGGSGITPMLGLITQALKQDRQVTLLHYYRGSTTVIASLALAPFESYWQHLADTHNNFNYHLVNTNDANSYLAGNRYLTTESLLALPLGLPSLLQATIFACGSQPLLSGLYQAINEIKLTNKPLINKVLPADPILTNDSLLKDRVIVEHFGTATLDSVIDENANKNNTVAEQTIYLRGRQQQFTTSKTLLLGAEQAGIRLNYGCRQGICQLCRCQKVSGVVKNLQTGKLSSNGFESIQTCINVAMSDVVLDP